ncbi:hypothetical protein [Burkholderia sp. SIMBA_062]|uniref:hypothetical protein n=1 Tax=Burkholderia sp. SIMBA_062 TaxID=3085803 RepID=UPI00397AEAAC
MPFDEIVSVATLHQRKISDFRKHYLNQERPVKVPAILGGHIIPTEHANLVRRALPFREAQRVWGELAKAADTLSVDVAEPPYECFAQAGPLFGEGVSRITVERMAARKDSLGSCGDQTLDELLARLRSMLAARQCGR